MRKGSKTSFLMTRNWLMSRFFHFAKDRQKRMSGKKDASKIFRASRESIIKLFLCAGHSKSLKLRFIRRLIKKKSSPDSVSGFSKTYRGCINFFRKELLLFIDCDSRYCYILLWFDACLCNNISVINFIWIDVLVII